MSPLTRRAALAAGGALLLAGPAQAAERRRRPPLPPGEPTVLYELIGRENEAAAAYRAAAGADPRLAAIAVHEAAHARALNSELAALGLNGPTPPGDGAALEGKAGALAGSSGSRDAVAAALALEEALLAAYAEAIRRLAIPNVVRTAATVMGSHGQHLAVLGRLPVL